MKRRSKRTCVWGMLTAGVLTTTAFSDNPAFGKVTSAETIKLEEKSNAKEDAKKLVRIEENKYGSTLSVKSSRPARVLSAGMGGGLPIDKEDQENIQTDIKDEDQEVSAAAVTLHLPIMAAAPSLAVTAEAVTEEAVSAEAVSPWADKALANVEDQANVRTQPSTEAELAGKIRRGDAADVVEAGEEWTLITSGNVTGYVKNEYLVFGDAIEALAEQQGKKVATVQVETLNVRKEPSTEAGIYEQAEQGRKYTCGAEADGWIRVSLSSGKTGYVSAQYVTTELQLGQAITIEEEQAAIRAEKEAAEKAAREKAAKEQAARERAEARKAGSQSVETNAGTSVQAGGDDLTLLAAVIELEAGTHYEGGIAVGNVVLNRVNSSRFPNSISGVIYQRGQFPGAHNGKLARILARGPKSACYQAAQAALNGQNVVGGRLFFNSQRSINYNKVSNYVLVGGNCFY